MNDKDSGIYAVEDGELHDAHVRALTTYREHNDEHSFESWKSFYAERRALVRQRHEREQTPARNQSELDSRDAALAAVDLKLEVLRKESEVASPYQIRPQKVRYQAHQKPPDAHASPLSSVVEAQLSPKKHKEQRQADRWQMCINAGLSMPTDTYAHFPRGIGKVADELKISRQALQQDLNAHRGRLFSK